jgi:hypothetical protein
VAVYCLDNNSNGEAKNVAAKYVAPFFHQSWTLFAPAPKSNYRFFAATDGCEEKDILQETIQNHRTNILAGKGSIVISIVNNLHFFENYVCEREKLNGPIKNNLHLRMLEHAALSYLNNRDGTGYNSVKLKVVVEDLQKGEMRVYFN